MSDEMKRKAEEQLKRRAKKVRREDLDRVLARQKELEDKFSSDGQLGRYIQDFKLLVAIITDYIQGKYKAIPFWTIAAIVAALAYILNPLDLLPDLVPVVGLVDDALVLTVCLNMVEQDLLNYKEWKKHNA